MAINDYQQSQLQVRWEWQTAQGRAHAGSFQTIDCYDYQDYDAVTLFIADDDTGRLCLWIRCQNAIAYSYEKIDLFANPEFFAVWDSENRDYVWNELEDLMDSLSVAYKVKPRMDWIEWKVASFYEKNEYGRISLLLEETYRGRFLIRVSFKDYCTQTSLDEHIYVYVDEEIKALIDWDTLSFIPSEVRTLTDRLQECLQ